MPFWETVAGVIGAVVAVAKAIKEFFFRPKPSPPTPGIRAVQSIFIVLPSAVVFTPVVLDEELRDLLEIPSWSHGDLTKPKLVIPGDGVVSVNEFVGRTLDELLIKADRPYQCAICGESRQVGGYFAELWYCALHLPGFVHNVASGHADTPWPKTSSGSTRDWRELRNLWEAQPSNRRIPSDPLLRRLGIIDDTSLAPGLGPSVPIRGLSGPQGSERHYTLDVPFGMRSLIVETEGDGDVDLYLRTGPTVSREQYDKRSFNASSSERCEIPNPVSGQWSVMLHGYKSYSNVSLSVRFRN
jgi:hypothetical protein